MVLIKPMNYTFIKESCVANFQEALAAQKQGATRIELCAQLDLDGLTPSIADITRCLKELTIPIKVMVRPRAGDFNYDRKDKENIFKDIKKMETLGVTEIVFGALNEDWSLDLSLIERVSKAANQMSITFHKAIDICNDPILAIHELKTFSNITSILSSGQAATARKGVDMLKLMKEACGDDIELIAAGKVTADNLSSLHEVLGLRAYHGRRVVDLD